MAKMRVYEYAKAINVSSKDIIAALKDMNIEAFLAGSGESSSKGRVRRRPGCERNQAFARKACFACRRRIG
ncbi:hypothetical protein DT075_25960 [Bacillus licheniformis]|nr:hypothetical protein DT075_25960 [Bacillus licheniformis]